MLYQKCFKEFDNNLRKVQIDKMSPADLQSSTLPSQTKEHFLKIHAAIKEAKKNTAFWTKVCVLLGIPAIVLTSLNAFFIEMEHEAHLKEHPLEYTAYDYMDRNVKKFPWGNGSDSLFYHPVYNKRD